jgi:hypothetical protein
MSVPFGYVSVPIGKYVFKTVRSGQFSLSWLASLRFHWSSFAASCFQSIPLGLPGESLGETLCDLADCFVEASRWNVPELQVLSAPLMPGHCRSPWGLSARCNSLGGLSLMRMVEPAYRHKAISCPLVAMALPVRQMQQVLPAGW